MKPNTRFLALTLAGALAAAPVISSVAAFAETPAQPPAAAPKSATGTQDKAVLTTVSDAYDAMRDVHLARIAIFNGDTEGAKRLAQSALDKMQAAQKTEADWAVPSKSGKAGVQYLPFDSSFALSEDFVASPDNAKAVSDANAKIATGDSKGAVDLLKSHDIALSVSAAMIPASDAVTELRHAQENLNLGKYYEASLSLKAVEDMAVIDNWTADAVPEQPGQTHQAAQATPPAAPAQSAAPAKG